MVNSDKSAWPRDAMTFYASGYTAGLEAGRASLDAEIAALHAVAYHAVQGNAKLRPKSEHWEAVHARWVARCETLKQVAEPWPDEDPSVLPFRSRWAVRP